MGFIQWHKERGENTMKKLGIGWYGVAWISWFKGVLAGLIIYHFLLM